MKTYSMLCFGIVLILIYIQYTDKNVIAAVSLSIILSLFKTHFLYSMYKFEKQIENLIGVQMITITATQNVLEIKQKPELFVFKE